MFIDTTIVIKVVETTLTTMATTGAKVLVDEAVKRITPEEINATKKACVEVAKWCGSVAAGTACANVISERIAAVEKFNELIAKSRKKDAEPVIKTDEKEDDDDIIDIDDDDDEEDEGDYEEFEDHEEL